jgi:predicted HNH restriction endonuclease
MTNLQYLCKSCHRIVHSEARQIKEHAGAK